MSLLKFNGNLSEVYPKDDLASICGKYLENLDNAEGVSRVPAKNELVLALKGGFEALKNACEKKSARDTEKAANELLIVFKKALKNVSPHRSFLGRYRDQKNSNMSLNDILAAILKDKMFCNTLGYYKHLAIEGKKSRASAALTS